MMRKNTLKISSAILSALLLGGCSTAIGMGSEIEKGPVGTGPTVKELKATPCACTEIPMNFEAMNLG